MADFRILLSDKREGETSFTSLNSTKREYRGEKVGHAGTLDKFASGLMIVLVGGATRLNPVFSSFGKSYRASLRFGEETDTLDPEGTVVAASAHIPTEEEIRAVLPAFLGEQLQLPPVYSAIHVDGKRAYQEARKGRDVEMEKRRITISSLDYVSYSDGVLVFDTAVSKGTYIRSLARDIALALGTRGHLCALRRTSIGPFTLSDLSLSTWELLERTGLFSTVIFRDTRRKEIDNGIIERSSVLSDSDPSLPYFTAYFSDGLYGIGEKGGKMRFLWRNGC